ALRADGIRLKCASVGEAGKGLQVAPRSQRAASVDGLMLTGKDRAFSMDDALPKGAQPFKQRTSAGKQVAYGAALGGGFGFALSLWSVMASPNGRTAGQKAEDVLVPTAVAAAEGASAVAVMQALEASSASTLARAAGGAGVAAVGAGVMIGWDAIKMARGRATVVELRKNAAANLGAGGGGLAGAAGGAALGSAICPGVGTVIGGLLGGLAAGFGGAKGGELLDKAIWDEAEDVKEQAFEFMHYGYTRWAKQTARSPEELQQRYKQLTSGLFFFFLFLLFLVFNYSNETGKLMNKR
ncbi:unnamed protein product, partial [Effrenium voratum]